MIKIGDLNADKIYFGGKEVKKIYKGSVLLYEKASPINLVVQGIYAVNRAYNGSNRVDINSQNVFLNGLIQGDDVYVTVGAIGYADNGGNVGQGIPVTLDAQIYGADASKYNITFAVVSVNIWAT